MLDFGFPELMVIIALAVLVVGPNDIPKLMLGLGRIMRRINYVRYAFTQQFDDFMRENDLEDIRKSVNFEARDFDAEDFDEEAADEEEVMKPLPPKEKEAADE